MFIGLAQGSAPTAAVRLALRSQTALFSNFRKLKFSHFISLCVWSFMCNTVHA